MICSLPGWMMVRLTMEPNSIYSAFLSFIGARIIGATRNFQRNGAGQVRKDL